MIFNAKQYPINSFKNAPVTISSEEDICATCGNKLKNKIFVTKDGRKFCSKSCKEDEGN